MTKMYKNYISIHALRVEGDFDYTLQACFVDRISIHALRVEGDILSNFGL